MINTFFNDEQRNLKLKKGVIITISIVNGVFYAMTIAEAGAKNVWDALEVQEGEGTNIATYILCTGAGLCCATFYYKIFQFLSLVYPLHSLALTAVLAPFSSFGFLTGGVMGGQIFFGSKPSIAIGLFLYNFRILTCVDASFKLPGRIEEIKSSWNNALENKNYSELVRLTTTGAVSLGYSIASMDAFYTASQIIAGWLAMTEKGAIVFSTISAILGAIGIFPLILYWTLRGLRQLTWGGIPDKHGNTIDPTDRYTFLALIIVLPNYFGIVGASVGAKSNILSFLGIFAEIMRLSSSFIYTVASGTPGISTLLRAFFKPVAKVDNSQLNTPILNPLLGDAESGKVMEIDENSYRVGYN